jgi:hypothetical protein
MMILPSKDLTSAYALFHSGILALARAERRGVRVNIPYVKATLEEITGKITQLERKFKATKFWMFWEMGMGGKANLYSAHQLAHILYNVKHIEPVNKTSTGQGAVDEDSLTLLGMPELQDLVAIKKLKKLQVTYLEAFLRETVNGRIHPEFNLNMVKTYRSSSSNPNFQNLPKRDKEALDIVRGALYPSRGHMFVEWDFKALEVGISACVTGDTMISTIDGNQPMWFVINRVLDGEDVYVFGYSKKKGRIAIRKVLDGGLTGLNKAVYAVTLDDGTVIKATRDHLFMLRNELYKRVEDLEPGDSLMPLYTSVRKSSDIQGGLGYRLWVNLNNGLKPSYKRWIPVHKLIHEDIFGKRDGFVIHHIDGDGMNNSLSNLQVITQNEHMSIHIKDYFSVEENRKNHGENSWCKTEAGRQWLSENNWMKDVNHPSRTKWLVSLKEGCEKRRSYAGKGNPNYGKHMSEESKQKIRDKIKERLNQKNNHTVVSVEFVGYENVYNLEVQGTHNYVAGGVVVHNCYNRDPKLIEYVTDPTTDMHGDMAEQIFFIPKLDKHIQSHKLLRQVSKNGFVFPQFYGSTYANCAKNMAFNWCKLPSGKWGRSMGIKYQDTSCSDEVFISNHLRDNGIRGYDAFVEHLKKVENDFWYKRFRVYQAWKDENWEQYQKLGYVDMYTGFRCRGVMRKTEVNNIAIQGSAFHCLLWSFIEIDKYCRANHLRSAPVLQIHDSIIMDMHPDEREELNDVIRDIMTVQLPKTWEWIIVPLDVETEYCTIDGSLASREAS